MHSSLRVQLLQQDSFQDSNSTEETFRQATSQPAAWQKKTSDRQFFQQQLGRRDFQQGSFHDSNLEDETFSTATSKKTTWKRHFALATSQRADWQLSLEQPSFQTRTSRTEPLELQRRTSTTELSQLERTALHTELAEFERPALTTELAQLQTSRFEESSFEFRFGEPSFDSLKSPAYTAQLCFQLSKASLFLGGGRFRTSPRRGGVLRRQLALTSLSFRTLGLKLRQLALERSLRCPQLSKYSLRVRVILVHPTVHHFCRVFPRHTLGCCCPEAYGMETANPVL